MPLLREEKSVGSSETDTGEEDSASRSALPFFLKRQGVVDNGCVRTWVGALEKRLRFVRLSFVVLEGSIHVEAGEKGATSFLWLCLRALMRIDNLGGILERVESNEVALLYRIYYLYMSASFGLRPTYYYKLVRFNW